MRTVLPIICAICTTAASWGDGALYIVNAGEKGTSTIEAGQLILRFPVVRAPVSHAVLRLDTEDAKLSWLELHMAVKRDPGDHISHFELAPKNAHFVTRGSEIHKDGCKWAIDFKSRDAGRAALTAIAKAYALDPEHARDETQP
jgi:hypothetical protein